MAEPDIRQPVPLRTLHGIEMAAVGTWNASTGTTTFTTEDFTDAVAALECPGVRNPVIKLGHAEEDSTSGVRWDGEPALGWVANMRFDGQKLIGDFTGMPGWLVDADENGLSVMAAAYPDRSVEIWRPFVCQIGHTHPAVVTAISLLGVAPPGVGVLRSMQDVYAAFTRDPGAPVQASALTTTVTLVAAGERRDLNDAERRSGIDFDRHREQWDAALSDLLDSWTDISAAQRDQLAAQITEAVDSNPDTLGDIKADSTEAAALLLLSMRGLAEQAAAEQVRAAEKQGVKLPAPDITDDDVRDVAEGVTAAMAAGTAAAAGRQAAQALGTGSGSEISDRTVAHLEGLTDRFLRDQLGGALSAAQHKGRLAALAGYDGPVELYASEINDVNACEPCRSIDGTRFDSRDAAEAVYGGGKYASCLAGARCRGQLIVVFDAAQASAPLSTTIATNLGGRMPAVVKASVSVEDISRRYYESAGYSMWITEMQVDPLQLIAADDATGKYYRIPVELKGGEFTFGDPQEVAITYQDVKAAKAKAPVHWGSRKVSLLAAGKNEDGTDKVAADVSPAGAAIRKAVHKAEAPSGVIDTEVLAEAEPETTETPDADPATGPTTTHEEASVDAAKMREALGLKPDASDQEVAEAFSAQVAAAAPAPSNEPDSLAVLTAKLPAGEKPILVDPENYKSLVTMAAKGELAFAKTVKAEGREFLAAAAREGRFPVARLSVYEEMWDRNPEETRAYVSLMPKNTVPTMAAGVMGQEISQNESDAAYAAYMGEVGL